MRNYTTLVLAGAALAFAVSLVTAADARERTAHGTYARANGKTGTFSHTATRQGGDVSASGSITNSDGQTVTHERERTVDRANGTASSSSEHNYPDGTSWSRESNGIDNGDGTTTIQTTFENRKGETGSISKTITHGN